MISLADELRKKLDQELLDLAKLSLNKLELAERSYSYCEQVLKKLKPLVASYNFKDEAEEINFFKKTLPEFIQELIYCRRVFLFEQHMPHAGKAALESYHTDMLNSIGTFFAANQPFYSYYRTAKVHYDTILFMRGKSEIDLMPESTVGIDETFTTPYSFKLAKLIANERFGKYVTLSQRDIDCQLNHKMPSNESLLVWTDSKVALIELAYALHVRGAIEGGKADIAKIIRTLEYTFNVDLGNFYRTYYDMGLRKKNRTPFLQALTEQLNRYMEEAAR